MANAAMKLDDLLAATRHASERISTARTAAATSSSKSMRDLETRLKEALGGDTLRGLANLVRGSEPQCYAAQLADKKHGIDTPLPDDGRAILAVDKHGAFVWLSISYRCRWATRPVLDEEFKAEHLAPAVRAVQSVLERHLKYCERTASNYDAVSRLSDRLADAVGFRF